MCVCRLVCICAMCMQCSQQPEGISSPGTRVMGRCQLPDVSAVLNWNPSQEQEVLWAHSLVLILCLCHLLKVMYTLGKSLIFYLAFSSSASVSFETRSCHIPQAGLKSLILLSQPLECWDNRCMPLCPALFGFLRLHLFWQPYCPLTFIFYFIFVCFYETWFHSSSS